MCKKDHKCSIQLWCLMYSMSLSRNLHYNENSKICRIQNLQLQSFKSIRSTCIDMISVNRLIVICSG